jgi:hypothetical protein
MYCENAEGTMGYFSFEVINYELTRIVNDYDGHLYWSTPSARKNESYDFSEKPDFSDEEIPDLITDFQLTELMPVQFEDLWQRSQVTD